MEQNDVDNELFFDVEDFYLCMNCWNIYEENPWECRGANGKKHAEFFDIAKFLGGHPLVKSHTKSESILRFGVSQITSLGSLKYIPNVTTLDLAGILTERYGFNVIKEFSTTQGRDDWVIENIKQDALNFAIELNNQGEKYFAFSNCGRGGFIGYTFMNYNSPHRSAEND